MKKLLTATLAIAMGATLVGALAACKNGDADTAKKAIQNVRTMYADKAVETPDNYTVIGQTKVGDDVYAIDWTVTSTFENFANYVSVGEMDATSKLVTVSVTKAEAAIDYKLIASVTVGSATETEEFTRKVPASQASQDQVEVSLSFEDKANRTSQDANSQVWEQNGIKLTNTKGSTDIGDYFNPIRLYKGSTVKVEYPNMVKLIFHSKQKYGEGKDDYPASVKGALEAANLGTVTLGEDEKAVILELSSPMDSIEFTASVNQIQLYSLDVVANKNAMSDADRVAGAKAALDLEAKNYIKVGEYDLPAELNGTTITWAVTSDYATIEGGKLKITSMPAADTEVILTATISKNEESDTKDITVKLVVLTLTGDGTQANPYTPTDAKKVIATLAEGATSTEVYFVKGYVIAPGTYSSQYGNFDDMYIADSYAEDKATTADDALLIYRPKADGTYLTAEGFTKGDLVMFKGNFQNYKKDTTLTPELVSGTCVERTSAADLNKGDADKVAAAKAAVELEATYYAGTVTLPLTMSGATLSWAVTAGATNATIEGGTMTLTAPAEAEADVTVTVTITSNSVTDTKAISFKVIKAPAGTQADPFTVAYAKTVGKALASGKYYGGDTATLVYVKGYVIDKGTWNDQYSNFTNVWLADSADDGKTDDSALACYRLAKDNVYITGQYKLHLGDLLTISCYIQNYNGTPQMTFNGKVNPTAVAVEWAPRTDAQKVADALEAVRTQLDDITATGETTLPTSIDTDVAFAWAAAAGTTLPAGITIEEGVLKVATLPAENTVISLTVTATCGTNGVSDTKTITVSIKVQSAAVLYTLTTSKTGTNNSYAGNCDVEVDGITWNIEGNSQQNPWRFGGKNLTNQDRKLTSKTAITGKVTEVVIQFGAANITVNSVTFNVYKTDPTVAGATVAYTASVTHSANGKYTINVPTAEDWTNCYYQVVFNVTAGSSNQYVTITSIVFNSTADSGNTANTPAPEAILNDDN